MKYCNYEIIANIVNKTAKACPQFCKLRRKIRGKSALIASFGLETAWAD